MADTEEHPYPWKLIHRWGSFMTAVIATGVVLSGVAGLLPFVTTDQLSARIIPIENEVESIERKLDELIRLDRVDRIDRINQELREIDRLLLETRSRVDSGEASEDSKELVRRLERDQRGLRRDLERLGGSGP